MVFPSPKAEAVALFFFFRSVGIWSNLWGTTREVERQIGLGKLHEPSVSFPQILRSEVPRGFRFDETRPEDDDDVLYAVELPCSSYLRVRRSLVRQSVEFGGVRHRNTPPMKPWYSSTSRLRRSRLSNVQGAVVFTHDGVLVDLIPW